MAGQVLPDLPDEIICKIIELVGEDSFYYLAGFLRAGKRGYALVHEPSVLKKCDVTPMIVGIATCQIGNGGQFREFFVKCVNAGNINAICYEGLHAATMIGLEESITILEPNVPTHGLSTFAAAIFNVCIGRDKEASQVFQLFAAHHADLRSQTIYDMEHSMYWLLGRFHAPLLNKYESSFQFPINMLPECINVNEHVYIVGVDGSCNNCKLFWICRHVCHML